jgi:hypothetical protein
MDGFFAHVEVGSAFLVMLIFGSFNHMACGASGSLVPFVNRSAVAVADAATP